MVPMARMSPPESNVCFAISIEAGTSNSFSPISNSSLERLLRTRRERPRDSRTAERS